MSQVFRPTEPKLSHLHHMWEQRLRTLPLRLTTAAFITAIALLAHIARRGTLVDKGICTAVVGIIAITCISVWIIQKRKLKHPESIIFKTTSVLDPSIAHSTVEAIKLVNASNSASTTSDPLTQEFSALYLRRVLSKLKVAELEKAISRKTRRYNVVLTVLYISAFFSIAVAPFRWFEGVNVWLATSERAPIAFRWYDMPVCIYSYPAYLDRQPFHAQRCVVRNVPVGTVVTMYIYPRISGRDFVLTDGSHRVSFTSDGTGHLRANWKVRGNVSLEVGAVFGDVTIMARTPITFQPRYDESPVVTLHQTAEVVELAQTKRIVIEFEAVDDHAITQVDLVLEQGTRQERRVLSKHPQRTSYVRGSTVVYSDDPWLKQAHLPVMVTIQARDGDTETGPKWGSSKPIIIVPPSIGRDRADRMQMLTKLRRNMIDRLNKRLELGEFASPNQINNAMMIESREQLLLSSAIKSTVNSSQPQFTIPHNLRTILLDHDKLATRVIHQALALCTTETSTTLAQSTRNPSAAPFVRCRQAINRLAQTLGDGIYAFDTALRMLGTSDAAIVARTLSDVAAHAEQTARQYRTTEAVSDKQLLESAALTLEKGQANLEYLGDLGTDLAEIVGVGVRRIRRCIRRDDMRCTEVAAAHLAARLRDPHPSFSSAAVPGWHSATMPSLLDDSTSHSSAAEQLEQQSRAIEQLALDHAQRVHQLRNSLQQANDDTARIEQAFRESANNEVSMAEKANQIIQQAQRNNLPLRKTTTDLLQQAEIAMRQAAQAMKKHNTQVSQQLQQQAQRLLEMTRETATVTQLNEKNSSDKTREISNTQPTSENRMENRDDTQSAKDKVNIPAADDFVGPEAYRRRILQGLRDPVDPSLQEAVKRYTRGLLR